MEVDGAVQHEREHSQFGADVLDENGPHDEVGEHSLVGDFGLFFGERHTFTFLDHAQLFLAYLPEHLGKASPGVGAI